MEYQDLAFSGRPIWLDWNDTIASTPASQLPRGLTPETKVFVQNGVLHFSNVPTLSDYDRMCLEELRKARFRNHQHIIVSCFLVPTLTFELAGEVGFAENFHVGRLEGFIDTSAGFIYAHKVRRFPSCICLS